MPPGRCPSTAPPPAPLLGDLFERVCPIRENRPREEPGVGLEVRARPALQKLPMYIAREVARPTALSHFVWIIVEVHDLPKGEQPEDDVVFKCKLSAV